MKLTKEVEDFFNNIPVMAMATVDNNGIPNVVAVATKRILNQDTIITIDTFHKKTKDNILQNGNLAVCMWEGSKGFQIKGIAKYHSQGKLFEENKQWILKTKPNKIVKGVIEIKVKAIFSIAASYEEAGVEIIN